MHELLTQPTLDGSVGWERGGSFGRSSSINEARLAVFFGGKKLHIASVVDCILCTAEMTVAPLYLRT